MEIRKAALDDYPDIVSLHNSLNIVWPAWPRDVDSWIEADRNRNPKCRFQRWVAIEENKIIGTASSGNRMDDYDPHKFYINVEVRESHRRRGVGTALYNQLMTSIQPHAPRILRTDILTNQIQSYPFVQQFGFREVWRETPVHLDMAAFDASHYADLEKHLMGEGIFIKTLNELKTDPERDKKVYELYMQLYKDVPSELAEFIPSPFEDWLQWCLHDPTTDPDAFFIALQGDQYIALHETGSDSSGQTLLGGLLGTLPLFRNKRIGLTLMLRAITFAQRHRITAFRTCTARVNSQMQALFDKLGFIRDPEWLQCEKVL